MKNFTLKTTLKLFAIIALFNIGIFAQNSFYGVRWQLTELNGQKVRNSKAFFEASKSQVSGNAGCNRMFGEVSLSRNRTIDFSRLGSTKMFCNEYGVMRLESDFLKALDRATSYSQSGNNLSLYNRNRLIMKFKAAETSNSGANLEDKKWILETVKNRRLPKVETAPFISFDSAKKSAGGNTSCNSFGGSFESSGETIRIFDLISTMRACIEDERMNVEREFKDGLQNANRYEIANGKLNLYRNKTLLLTFRGENKTK